MTRVERSQPLSAALAEFAQEMPQAGLVRPARVALDPDDVKNGLGRLVLTLVELIRQLLERQAIRRMDSGSLLDVEVERLGNTFLKLDEHMQRLKKEFGLEGEDLNLDLGPLGKLL